MMSDAHRAGANRLQNHRHSAVVRPVDDPSVYSEKKDESRSSSRAKPCPSRTVASLAIVQKKRPYKKKYASVHDRFEFGRREGVLSVPCWVGLKGRTPGGLRFWRCGASTF